MNAITSEWGKYLTSYHWQAIATASYRRPVSYEYSQFAAKEWIAKLGPSAYAFVAHETGPFGGRVHVHALIGGIFDGARSRTALDTRGLTLINTQIAWRDLDAWHGNVHVELYDPREGGAWYVTKCHEDGEFVGVDPVRHRDRRRRS